MNFINFAIITFLIFGCRPAAEEYSEFESTEPGNTHKLSAEFLPGQNELKFYLNGSDSDPIQTISGNQVRIEMRDAPGNVLKSENFVILGNMDNNNNVVGPAYQLSFTTQSGLNCKTTSPNIFISWQPTENNSLCAGGSSAVQASGETPEGPLTPSSSPVDAPPPPGVDAPPPPGGFEKVEEDNSNLDPFTNGPRECQTPTEIDKYLECKYYGGGYACRDSEGCIVTMTQSECEQRMTQFKYDHNRVDFAADNACARETL